LADPADREQQDGAGDRHEDVVEAGDEAEILLVDRGRCPLVIDKGAKGRGGFGADRAAGYRLVQIILAVH
jgi:hypothetical protein